MGIVQATTPGTFLVGSVSAVFVEDKVQHTFTTAAVNLLDTVNWNQIQAGQIEIKYFINWKSGNAGQALQIGISLDGTIVPLSSIATSGAIVSSDVNDFIQVSGSLFQSVSAGAHTVTLSVAYANVAATYNIYYSQLGIR